MHVLSRAPWAGQVVPEAPRDVGGRCIRRLREGFDQLLCVLVTKRTSGTADHARGDSGCTATHPGRVHRLQPAVDEASSIGITGTTRIDRLLGGPVRRHDLQEQLHYWPVMRWHCTYPSMQAV